MDTVAICLEIFAVDENPAFMDEILIELASGKPMPNPFTPGIFEKWYYTTPYKEGHMASKRKESGMTEVKEIQGAPIASDALPDVVTQSYDAYPILQDIGFATLLDARLENATLIKALQERNAEIDEELKPAMLASEVKSVYYGDHLVVFTQNPGARRLDKVLLLKNGVSTEQIEASMKQGKPSSSISVRARNATAGSEHTE